jgi:hypothetical protein
MDRALPRRRDTDPHVGSSIYPAVQNAARSESARPRRDIDNTFVQFEKEAEAYPSGEGRGPMHDGLISR